MNMPLNTELTHQNAESPVRHRQEVVLPTPAELRLQMPASDAVARQVDRQRQEIREILQGNDARALIVMGPTWKNPGPPSAGKGCCTTRSALDPAI